MEVVQSRYGTERIIHKVTPNKLRIQGESLFLNMSEDDSGNVIMFDFEGGPSLTVGGEITFQGLKWKINKINPIDTGIESFVECSVEVDPIY